MKLISSQAGISIIEILIGVFIFVVGILAVVTLQVTSIKGNSFSRGVTEAASLAQGQIEKLMGLDYENLKSENPVEDPAERYDLSWVVSENDTLDNTKNILVEVVWYDKGVKKLVRLQSLKARGL